MISEEICEKRGHYDWDHLADFSIGDFDFQIYYCTACGKIEKFKEELKIEDTINRH